MDDRLVGPSEAADRLGVERRSVQRWIDDGLIPAHKTPGGHRRVREADLVEFARRQRIPLRPVRRSVLVVDDDPDFVEALSVRIEKTRPDLEVHAAESGVEAGVLLASVRPHLVLLDIRMPGVSGIDLCRMLKANPATAETAVVGVTGSTKRAEIEALKRAGAEAVITKPIGREVIRDLLDRFFGPARADAPAAAAAHR
jgi:excisionase family DNA binding protein